MESVKYLVSALLLNQVWDCVWDQVSGDALSEIASNTSGRFWHEIKTQIVNEVKNLNNNVDFPSNV